MEQSQTLLELDKNVCNVQQMARENQSHEKPPHSFIALISMAILSSPEKKMVVDDIYHYISQTFSFYKIEVQNWKGSIRYNLSMHECFRKVGKNESGRGSYWTVDPTCEDDFRNGDYKRRQTRKRIRRSKRKPNEPKLNVPRTPAYVPYHPYSFNGAQQSIEAKSDCVNLAAPLLDQQANCPFGCTTAQYTEMPQYGYVHDRANMGRNDTAICNNAQNGMVDNWVMQQQGSTCNIQQDYMSPNNSSYFVQ